MDRGKLRLLFRDSGYKVGAEIGVERGRNAKNMFLDIPGLKLFCVDMWVPFESDYMTAEYMANRESVYREAKRRLSKYNAVIIRKYSVDAAKDIPDGSLDFVYIDANHEYDFIMQDLIVWTPKVRIGGIVSGHDYHPRLWGVVPAVNDYTRFHKIDNVFYTGEGAPSFWWVRK